MKTWPTKILKIILMISALFFPSLCGQAKADLPCAPREIQNRSVVCVCNSTYCDEITRDVPCEGQYFTYSTSAAGSRFKKGNGFFKSSSCSSDTNAEYTITLDVTKRYQTIKGFGGAVTDAAGINWKSLPEAAQQHFINSYFSNIGLEYNIVRVPIACSDFSTHRYTYHDQPGDKNLDEFALQEEDLQYKIPMLKEIFKVSTAPVKVIASSWTPPEWMRYTTQTNTKCGYLKREHFQTFADYLIKFISSYEKHGINIWGITTSNEPTSADFPNPIIPCLGWSIADMGNWIVNNLGPTLRNSKYRDVKILALDDQLYTIKLNFDLMVRNNSKVLDFVDGIATHYYTDCFVSPTVNTYVTETYPKLFVISTEACAGFKGSVGVDLGSWSNAKTYIRDIIRDLNHDTVGWVDWNLCLNGNGGPNYEDNFVDSPVVVDAEKQEFVKQPMFYALGHISKFIPRGSVRIAARSPQCDCSIPNVAFLTPSNTIVVVLHNVGKATSVTLRQDEKEATLYMEADSIMTVEFLNK